MLFSIVRLLLPYGDFISHSSPLKRMSGVGMCLVGINSTSSPVHDKIVATLNSWGCTNAFFGTVIWPTLCLFGFLIELFYHLSYEKTTPKSGIRIFYAKKPSFLKTFMLKWGLET